MGQPLIWLAARWALAATRLSSKGSASARRVALAVRWYWAPTGKPCRLLVRASSISAT